MLLTALLLAGCDTFTPDRAEIDLTMPNGTSITVKSPQDAVAPATVDVDPENNLVTINSGNKQEKTARNIVAENAEAGWWIGAGLIAAGVFAFAFKAYLPLIPTSLGTTLMLAGGVVIAMAIGLPQIPAWGWTAIVATGIACVVVPGFAANWFTNKKLKQTNTQTPPGVQT
jgi:hypothetical protein